MIPYTCPIEEIIKDFEADGIDINCPGFYDHPNFIRNEKKNNLFLGNYARFVTNRTYDPGYIERARKEIPIICEMMHRELERGDLLGKCIDGSMVLSRLLEKEGFWNCMVKGALTIRFPEKSKIGRRYFWPVDHTQAVAGHVWIIAPPFKIVDVTLGLQPYAGDEKKWLPPMVLAERAFRRDMVIDDILSGSVQAQLTGQGVPRNEQLKQVNPNIEEFTRYFQTYMVRHNETELKYIAIAASAPAEQLDGILNISFSGRTPVQLYEELVMPTLATTRI